MSISVYLTFDGDCREAFEFYNEALDGEMLHFSTFAEMPNCSDLAPEDLDKIMHASLKVGDSILMASDNSGSTGSLVKGGNFSLCLDTESREQTDALLARLSEGGRITVPAEDTFWGAYFAMCTDRFGISWMFVCEINSEETVQ